MNDASVAPAASEAANELRKLQMELSYLGGLPCSLIASINTRSLQSRQ